MNLLLHFQISGIQHQQWKLESSWCFPLPKSSVLGYSSHPELYRSFPVNFHPRQLGIERHMVEVHTQSIIGLDCKNWILNIWLKIIKIRKLLLILVQVTEVVTEQIRVNESCKSATLKVWAYPWVNCWKEHQFNDVLVVGTIEESLIQFSIRTLICSLICSICKEWNSSSPLSCKKRGSQLNWDTNKGFRFSPRVFWSWENWLLKIKVLSQEIRML